MDATTMKVMERGFFDELTKISMQEDMEALAASFFQKHARALTSKARNKLSEGSFVFPAERRYPIHDEAHARNALARASGKSEEAQVRAAVHAKFPNIGKEKQAFTLHELRTGALIGGGAGAALGGISGVRHPGVHEDGTPKSRVVQAVKRGLKHGIAGGVTGPVLYVAMGGDRRARDVAARAKSAFTKKAGFVGDYVRRKVGDEAKRVAKKYAPHAAAAGAGGLAAVGGAAYAGSRLGAKHALKKHEEKKADIVKVAIAVKAEPWMKQVATHAAMGAVPGAAVGAATAKKDEQGKTNRLKGALKGGAIGAATGAAAGHMYLRGKRDIGAAAGAAKKVGFDVKDFGKQDPKTKEKFHRLSHMYRQATPIYKTAAHDTWGEEKKDKKPGFVSRHKGKLLGGLALATAAGVGGKLLHSKLKARPKAAPAAHAPPPTAAARHAAAPAPMPQAEKVRPKKEQGAAHRGTTVDIPGKKPGERTTLADLQAAQNDRKQGRKKKFENERPRRDSGDHDFEE
jgi:hypothetical protein